jgi:hypothetical protein
MKGNGIFQAVKIALTEAASTRIYTKKDKDREAIPKMAYLKAFLWAVLCCFKCKDKNKRYAYLADQACSFTSFAMIRSIEASGKGFSSNLAFLSGI